MLETVWFKIEENRTIHSEQLFLLLQKKGIPCKKTEPGEKRTADELKKGSLFHTVLLTDDRELVRRAAEHQVACVGVAGADDAFFEGADLVVQEPESLELRELEEYVCHCHGIPVTIAQTRRLVLREMAADDWQVLDRISRQRGMEKARRDAKERDFERERLAAYIRSQYRLYGYGLWSVVLADADNKETIIGCCGFSEMDAPSPALELQYMLDEAYRRKGYGTEMCRAAISYAYEYLEAKEIWVRIRSDYPAALSFAQSLGFCRTEPAQNPEKPPASGTAREFLTVENMAAARENVEAEILWLRHGRFQF